MKKKIFLLMLVLIIPFYIFAEEEVYDTTAIYGASPELTTVDNEVTYEKGSQFSIGNEIDVIRYVDGIFFAIGSEAKVNGNSEYGIFAGLDLEINTRIDKELFALGENVTINTTVNRDTYVAASNLKLSGSYAGKLEVFSKNVDLENVNVNGTMRVYCQTMNIGENVTLESIHYNDSCIITGLDKTNIDNITTYHKNFGTSNEEKSSFVTILSEFFTSFLMLLFTGYIINFAFPGIYKKLNNKLEIKALFKSACSGLAIMFIVPIVALIAMVVVITVPAAIIVLALYAILLYIAKLTILTVIGNAISTKLLNKKDRPYLAILIGVALYELLILIPYIKTLTIILALLIGLSYVKDMLFQKK